MEEALRQKDAGNAAFKAGKLDSALSCYQQAVLAISDDHAASEVRRNLYGNMSMVLLKTGDAKRALEAANHAIAEDSAWSKGHFRRGSALIEFAVSGTEEMSAQEARAQAGDAFRKVRANTWRQSLRSRGRCWSWIPRTRTPRQSSRGCERLEQHSTVAGCAVLNAAGRGGHRPARAQH